MRARVYGGCDRNLLHPRRWNIIEGCFCKVRVVKRWQSRGGWWVTNCRAHTSPLHQKLALGLYAVVLEGKYSIYVCMYIRYSCVLLHNSIYTANYSIHM